MYQTSCESSWWQRSPYPFGPPRSGGGVAAGSSPGALGPPPSPWRGGPPGPACFLRPSGSAWLWLFGGLPGGRGLLSVALLGRCVGVCVWACVGIILGDLGSWRIWLGRRRGLHVSSFGLRSLVRLPLQNSWAPPARGACRVPWGFLPRWPREVRFWGGSARGGWGCDRFPAVAGLAAGGVGFWAGTGRKPVSLGGVGWARRCCRTFGLVGGWAALWLPCFGRWRVRCLLVGLLASWPFAGWLAGGPCAAGLRPLCCRGASFSRGWLVQAGGWQVIERVGLD